MEENMHLWPEIHFAMDNDNWQSINTHTHM